MDVGKIIVGESSRPGRDQRIDPAPAWKALAWFTLLFVSVGLVDMALVLVATDMTGPVARLGAYAGLSSGLPLLTIGTVGLLMSGIGSRSRGIILLATVLSVLFVLGIVTGLTLMMSSSDAAFANAQPAAHAAMRQTMARGVVFYAAFGAALGIACLTGIRASRRTVET